MNITPEMSRFVETIAYSTRIVFPFYPDELYCGSDADAVTKNKARARSFGGRSGTDIFKEMRRNHISWETATEMLNDVRNYRNSFLGMNLGNFNVTFEHEGIEFVIRRYGKIIHIWDKTGGTSYGEIKIADPSVPPTIEFENELLQILDEVCDGYIRCSKCGKKIKKSEIAGHYFAGIYCDYCWENGIKQQEATETYD